MKSKTSLCAVIFFAVFIFNTMISIPVSANPAPAAVPNIHASPYPGKSPVYALLDIALEATAREHIRNGARPTLGSRMLGIVVNSMYDAWAAFDDKALGTRLGASLRIAQAYRTPENKEKALAFATYRSLLYLFPEDEAWVTGAFRKFGFDPGNLSINASTPEGIGNLAASAIIEYRRGDGSNQHGDEVGSNGKPYSDYTYYVPANPSDKIINPDLWQPLPFDDGKGGTFHPGFLTPHWYRVKPFALKRSDQFRPSPPPKVGSRQLEREVDEAISLNANLSMEHKAIVEFMRDGPKSTGQSGHWLRFAQDLSRRDKYTMDQDVKLFFAVGMAAMDGFIAAWEAKRFYNTSRPWTLVKHYYAGKTIQGWAGPGQGVKTMPAEHWRPYSPAVFPTPPFPGYVSGHSTVSAACARILELYSGGDGFGFKEIRKAGALTEPDFSAVQMQRREGKPGNSNPSGTEVVLDLPTFSATAEMAGISRIMGGYHIQADNIAGLKLGREVADYVWPEIQSYFNGNAKIASEPAAKRSQ